MTITDSTLVQEARDGKLGAFQTLVERYQDAVFGVALSKTGCYAEAQDVAQEAFLAAFRGLAQLKAPERFGAWLYRIAVNESRKRIRQRLASERGRRNVPQSPPAPAPDVTASRNEIREAVMQALRELCEANRETATLFLINGYSIEDISRFTGRPLGTVKRRLHDARKQLQGALVTMVEKKLKQARPGKEFTRGVVRRIRDIHVGFWKREQNALLLTDADNRSFPVIIGDAEARAIAPWVRGKASIDDLDMHSAIIRSLGTFGASISDVAITAIKNSTFFARMRLRRGNRSCTIDCRPSDALNLAIRVDAPIYVAAKVVDQMLLKDSQGKPIPPRTAVRDLRTLAKPPAEDYPNVAAALRVLALQPGCQQARNALSEISGRHTVPPRIRDAAQGVEQVEAWAKRHQGTPLEAVGLGLVGAAHLWGNQRDPAKALPYLERAYKLAPDDRPLAFDLATAYALLNRKREALGLLRKHDLPAYKPDFGELTNFEALRRTAWFRKHTQDRKPDTPRWFMSFQFRVAGCERESPPSPRGSADAEDTPKAPPGVKTYPISKMSSQHKQMRAALFADTPLWSLDHYWGSYVRGRQRSAYYLLLRVETGEALGIMATPHELSQALLPPYTTPRPMTATTAVRTLRRLGIRLEAVVIQRQVRSVPHSVLVLTDGTRWETVPIAGLAAVALALVAKCPLLIADHLAKQLTLRDDTGNPIPFDAAREYFFPNKKWGQ